jgi:hypothetical protein
MKTLLLPSSGWWINPQSEHEGCKNIFAAMLVVNQNEK